MESRSAARRHRISRALSFKSEYRFDFSICLLMLIIMHLNNSVGSY